MVRVRVPVGRVVAVGLLGFAHSVGAAGGEYRFHHENVMGTSMELRIEAANAEAAQRGETRVLEEIDRLVRIFSGYDRASEFSRWQAGSTGAYRVSPELFEVLSGAEDWRRRSGGAFNVRARAVSGLWARCERENRLPTTEERRAAAVRDDSGGYGLDSRTGTVERRDGVVISLDGIAKGYVVERAAARAFDPTDGVRCVVLNIGGDLRCVGETAQRVGVAPARGDSENAEPVRFIRVRNRSVSTSGDAYRGFRIDGRWYSHIVDPRTGEPVREVVAATVVAPRGLDADALATLFNVLEPETSLRVAGGLEGVACRIVGRDGRVWQCARWAAIEEPTTRVVTRASLTRGPQAKAGWGESRELELAFEINRPTVETGRYRRPYVVVWVEDAKGRSVRTLLVWISLGGAGPDQWLPDLSRWYRGDAGQTSADRKGVAYTIGRPTRPPGSYSVIWDGKDDQGRPVPEGRYTVCLETAREHGPHSLLRKQVELSGEPFVVEVPGNEEIKGARIEYRAKKGGSG